MRPRYRSHEQNVTNPVTATVPVQSSCGFNLKEFKTKLEWNLCFDIELIWNRLV
jgi:hypothetical protein